MTITLAPAYVLAIRREAEDMAAFHAGLCGEDCACGHDEIMHNMDGRCTEYRCECKEFRHAG